MKEAIAVGGAFAIILISVAWVTILPTLGLLWLCGALS